MKIFFKIVFSLVIFLSFSQEAFSQGGDNAAAAAASPITLPFNAPGTTCGRVDNYNFPTFCTCTGGADWLYYFCAPTSGVIDIFMTNAYGVAPAIIVYNGVPNATGSTYVASSITGSNINSLVSLTVTAGNCFYVMIDNDPSFADLGEACFDYTATIQYHTSPPAAPLQPACSNIGYDAGNLSGWVGTTGVVTLGAAGAPTPSYNPLYYTTSAQQHSVTSGGGVDPYGGFPIVNPAGATNSLRLGDLGAFGTASQYFGGVPGAGGSTIEQKYTVTASNALFVYYYAVVLQDAGADHTNQEQPFFKTDIFDCSGNSVACGQYLVTGGPGIPGFTLAGAGSNVYYKNWSPVAVDLTPYIGTCVTVRYTVGDCTRGAHFAYAYIDATCSPLAITGVNQVCPTKSTTLYAPVGLYTYSWTPGGQTTQSVVVTPTATTTYSCELTSYSNCKTYLTYTVSLFPAALASASSQTVCNGVSATLTSTVNNGAGTYSWAPSGGAGSSANFSPSATTNYTMTYTDGNGCQDTAIGRVTVNPLPTMTVPASPSVCHGANVAASAFTSTVAGTTFSWTNTNTSIGLGANGSGNTPAFITSNLSASPVTAIISVTPTANNCAGTPVTYSIVVNPIPNINAITSSTYCSGATVPTTAFSGSVTATTYSWTNTNATIGLGASGAGNIASFTSANSGAATSNGVITVTPTANSCVGLPTNFTITVNPIPTVNAVPSGTYCNGALVAATTFSGSVTAAIYNWTNTNTTIGLAGSGVGDIASFTGINNGSAPISGIITVTPSANSCVGTPTNFTITVNPIPNVNAITSSTYCSGATVPATAFSGSVTATTYSWTNTNSTIGLAATGVGSIASYGAVNNSSAPTLGVITVTPSANSCLGTPTDFTVTVNPIPTVNAIPSGTYCNGNPVAAVTFTGNVATATYSWTNTNTTIGLGASGIGNIASYNAINNGSAPIAGVITVTPSANACIGTPTNFTVTVNPIPTVNAVPSGTYCNGNPVAAVNFTGNVATATYSWTNTNSTIGLGASGVGNIASYNATNNGTAPIAGIITVTPSANSCIGTPTDFTVTVNPIPTVNAIPSGTYCNGNPVTAVTFTGNVATATYSWTNTNSTIGLGASGIGNIASYNAINNSSAPTAGVITVTPSANSCIGTPTNFTVTVNPIPVVDAVPSGTYCNGAPVPAVAFTGSVTSTTYSWTNTNSTIGLGASGVGNIASYNAANNGTAPIAGVITVTPSANSCIGTPTNYTVTVNPIPTVIVPPSTSICNGLTVTPITFTGNISNAVYNWTNTNPAIGVGSSGVGNIPSFVATNGGLIPITGVISVTPSANSCIGNAQTFSITVDPTPLAPTVANQTICPGSTATLVATAPGATYSWYDAVPSGNLLASNTATYTTPALNITTSYYVNTVNIYGCIGPFTQVDVTVLNFLPLTISPNQTICVGGNAPLSVSPTGAGYTYTWTTSGNANFSNSSNPTVTPVTTSVYSVTVTSPDGCTGTDNTQVLVNPLPIANAGNPIAFCNGQSGNIGAAAVSGYSYSWTPGNGLSNPSVSNPTVTLPNGGSTPSLNDYTLTVTLNGCQSSNSVQVTVNPIPVSNAGSPITLCAGQTGTIGVASTTGYSYSWSPPTNLSSSAVSNPTVSGVNAGASQIVTTYIVTTTETATTCQSNASVTVTVLPLPTVNAGTVPSACAGTTNLPLNGIIGGSASGAIWSGGGGNYSPSNLSASGAYNPTPAEFASGSVTLTLTATAPAPCQNVTSNVVINFYPNPVITFSVDNPKGCPEHCVIFTDQSSISAPDVIQSWLWNFGDGTSSTDKNPSHCYNTPGFYNVSLTAASNHLCPNQLTIAQMIEVYPEPIASFFPTPLTAGILDPNFTFQNTSQGAVSYYWDFGDQMGIGTVNTSTLTNPSHAYTYAGTYDTHLQATSIHGCVSIASVKVEVLPEFVFYIPNAFTPNNADGINDIFTGAGIGIEKYEMWIFDRWGANIYYSDDIHKGWNGKMLGKEDVVQQDVYIWKVKLKDVFDRTHDYIGHVTLLK